ncbi:DUF58 domain-containing protein [Lentisphaera profundi]|uniref:DUF58 domain-containing protein n=1 Tax=Lentisphaera profundi TaxID=1658616 RepID=A0ABY7VTX4_9BACT|nr:DUF58 domain-containing protein [Lentisphaera profundi]WDE96204.1 DUF58 domain-containing protein [Lentisphaera profundi]
MKNQFPEGAYTSLKQLLQLQYKSKGYSFLPNQPLNSVLAGRHSSRLRGRGLDFEELRMYQRGDDTRTIDWKVSNRTRKPYVRVYGEEKERQVMFLVDQRLSMFFGSQRSFKSVSAAECLALGAWKVIDSGDRVGGIIFNDSEIREFKAQRSRKSLSSMLNETVKMNQNLAVNKGIEENPLMLNKALNLLLRKAKHNTLFIIISDFSGLNEDTHHHVQKLSQHNDVVLALIYDKIAREFPHNPFPLRVSDGLDQVELDLSSSKLRKSIPDLLEGRLKSLSDALNKFHVPILPINTHEDVSDQLRSLLGNGTSQPSIPTRIMRGSRT